MFLRRLRSKQIEEVEMWPKGALFFCLSFFVLPLLARKYWEPYQEDQNLISRLRTSGVL
jgi:hypothetical protein